MLLDRANECVPHNSPYCSPTDVNQRQTEQTSSGSVVLFTWSVRLCKPHKERHDISPIFWPFFSRHPPAISSLCSSLPSSFMVWLFLYIRPFATIWSPFTTVESPPLLPPVGGSWGGVCAGSEYKSTTSCELRQCWGSTDGQSTGYHNASALRILLLHSEP